MRIKPDPRAGSAPFSLQLRAGERVALAGEEGAAEREPGRTGARGRSVNGARSATGPNRAGRG